MSDDDDDIVPVFGSRAASPSSASNTSGPLILNDLYELEKEDVSDEEDIPKDKRSTAEYQELMWLKRIRREKELEQRSGKPWVHHGFRCDGCQMEPIRGGRFQCTKCKEVDTVDFCCDCAPKGLEVGRHTKDHILRPVRKRIRKELGVDQDYIPANQNYLDPNFEK